MVKPKNDIERGGLRRLTLGEINLARTLYAFSIRYNEVWIHRGSYLPFNMQANDYAMTPNGEMYFQEGVYVKDFAMPKNSPGSQHLFLHEMMHVWQHQHGVWVRTRGLVSWAADYHYELDKSDLFDYSMEQQACIVSDYWLLKNYGFVGNSTLFKLKNFNPNEPTLSLLNRYKNILGSFPH
ncbi:type IV secretion protein Rhs [Enterobacteriaceae bacterium C23F]